MTLVGTELRLMLIWDLAGVARKKGGGKQCRVES